MMPEVNSKDSHGQDMEALCFLRYRSAFPEPPARYLSKSRIVIRKSEIINILR